MFSALVWGSSVKHNPQKVGKEHILNDEDVVQVVKKLVTIIIIIILIIVFMNSFLLGFKNNLFVISRFIYFYC